MQDECGSRPGSPGHPYPFTRPFNNHTAGLGTWQFNPQLRANITQLFTYDVPDARGFSTRKRSTTFRRTLNLTVPKYDVDVE